MKRFKGYNQYNVMCTLLLRGGELQSTLGFVKEAQIQPDPEEEPRGLGWQLWTK